MINFYSEISFELDQQEAVGQWVSEVIDGKGFDEGEVTYVFCDDEYLHKLNVQFLDHDTLTDIISFDYSVGKQLHGEIYISVERVRENALNFNEEFQDELHRVIIHGILHYCGYKDNTEEEASTMREQEEFALKHRNFL